MPARERVRGRADPALLPVDGDLPTVDGVGAGDRPQELAPAAPDKAGKPHDLALADGQRYVAEHAGATQALDLEHHRRGRGGRLLELLGLGGRAEHAGNEALLGLGARGRGPHEVAVAHHGHRVAELEHLVEEVAHVDDRLALVAQRPRHLVERLGLHAGQRRGRLVHDDDPGVAVDGAQDLDLLLVGGAQRPDGRVAVELEAAARDELGVLLSHLAPLMQPARRGSMPRKTFCITLIAGASASSCAIVAIPSSRAARGVAYFTARPSTNISPSSGRTTPPMTLPRVDLPAPFAPTRACTVPALISRLTSSRALVPA